MILLVAKLILLLGLPIVTFLIVRRKIANHAYCITGAVLGIAIVPFSFILIYYFGLLPSLFQVITFPINWVSMRYGYSYTELLVPNSIVWAILLALCGYVFDKFINNKDKSQGRELKIRKLPQYHDAIMSRVLALRKFSDPVSFVNENIIVRCPKCGLIYNSVGFEVGYLAALASTGIPTTFSSGGQGMYGRASRGLCPNPNCTSTTAVVEWRGGELGNEQLIPDKTAKEDLRSSEVPPPSQSTENVSALVLLGKKYLIGHEVPQDFQEARKHFCLAADMGNADAQFFLGNMYDKGDGVPQDYKEALKWYRLAADQGHAIAQFCVGVFYRDGFGVPQDYYEGAKWTRLAAEQGYDEAQFNLGVMYYHGLGVAQDIQKAAMWWRRAADQGNANAKHNLSAIE